MHCSQPREKQNRVHDFLVFLICFHLQQVRKGYSARNLFRLLFYFLEFFLYNRNTVFRTISESLFFFFSWLQCVKQEFTFLFLQKIRRSVLVIYKLELRIYLIIPNVSLKFFPIFLEHRSSFREVFHKGSCFAKWCDKI